MIHASSEEQISLHKRIAAFAFTAACALLCIMFSSCNLGNSPTSSQGTSSQGTSSQATNPQVNPLTDTTGISLLLKELPVMKANFKKNYTGECYSSRYCVATISYTVDSTRYLTPTPAFSATDSIYQVTLGGVDTAGISQLVFYPKAYSSKMLVTVHLMTSSTKEGVSIQDIGPNVDGGYVVGYSNVMHMDSVYAAPIIAISVSDTSRKSAAGVSPTHRYWIHYEL